MKLEGTSRLKILQLELDSRRSIIDVQPDKRAICGDAEDPLACRPALIQCDELQLLRHIILPRIRFRISDASSTHRQGSNSASGPR
jgi:hypothetical protein